MKEFNNLKDECINAFNQFWNNCLENARKQLKKDGYIEIKEGIFKCLINNYSNLYLSDIATDILENTIDKTKTLAGYYIKYSKDNPLNDWMFNTEGYTLTEKDKEVQKILEEIYG